MDDDAPLLARAHVHLADPGMTLTVNILAAPDARKGLAVIAPKFRRGRGNWQVAIEFDRRGAWFDVADAARQAYMDRVSEGR